MGLTQYSAHSRRRIFHISSSASTIKVPWRPVKGSPYLPANTAAPPWSLSADRRTMQPAPLATYIRVSTSGQGRSGLGIEVSATCSLSSPRRRVSRLLASSSRSRQGKARMHWTAALESGTPALNSGPKIRSIECEGGARKPRPARPRPDKQLPPRARRKGLRE